MSNNTWRMSWQELNPNPEVEWGSDLSESEAASEGDYSTDDLSTLSDDELILLDQQVSMGAWLEELQYLEETVKVARKWTTKKIFKHPNNLLEVMIAWNIIRRDATGKYSEEEGGKPKSWRRILSKKWKGKASTSLLAVLQMVYAIITEQDQRRPTIRSISLPQWDVLIQICSVLGYSETLLPRRETIKVEGELKHVMYRRQSVSIETGLKLLPTEKYFLTPVEVKVLKSYRSSYRHLTKDDLTVATKDNSLYSTSTKTKDQ